MLIKMWRIKQLWDFASSATEIFYYYCLVLYLGLWVALLYTKEGILKNIKYREVD